MDSLTIKMAIEARGLAMVIFLGQNRPKRVDIQKRGKRAIFLIQRQFSNFGQYWEYFNRRPLYFYGLAIANKALLIMLCLWLRRVVHYASVLFPLLSFQQSGVF